MKKDEKLISRYKVAVNLNNLPDPVFPAQPKGNYPSPSDYEAGFFRRYFVRQANSPQSPIIELDKKIFKRTIQKDKNGFWIGHIMPWRISGTLSKKKVDGVLDRGVLEANYNAIEAANKKLPGIKSEITNLVQYYDKINSTGDYALENQMANAATEDQLANYLKTGYIDEE
jgi:hypothetical protein